MSKKPSTAAARRLAARDEKLAVRSREARDGRGRFVKGGAKMSAADSYQNFGLALGLGTANALSGSTYGFNPITRVRTLIEWIYRGTWIGGVAVDLRAEDMTRAGIQLNTTMPPDDGEKLLRGLTNRGVWRGIRDTKRWASLYGGAVGVLLVEGQDLSTPLRVDTIAKGQFKGVAVLDRWMVEPTLSGGGLVEELGPNIGKPKFYNVRSDSSRLPSNKIHDSRCLRLLGDDMPYWQSVMENLWGTSVYERIYDRLVAFDSATQGAAQTVYKSYVRTYKINKLREIVTAGGQAYQGLIRYVDMMRRFQGIEGITIIDGNDDFVAHTPSVQSGISEALVQFGQQLCGALKVPAVRLFGMSPAGLNSTGDSDWRNYYDGINSEQESDLREFVDLVCRIEARNQGLTLPESFGFNFTSLWQMTEAQKAEVAGRKTETVLAAQSAAIVGKGVALKELRQQSHETGVWTNITDEDIKEAEEDDAMAPPGLEALAGGAPGAGGPVPGEGGATPAERPARPPEPRELSAGPRDSGLTRDDVEAWLRRRRVGDGLSLPLAEVGGLPLVIECRRGEERWPGKVWPADYGYIRKTASAEGLDECMDCFVGQDRDSDIAFVINHFRKDGSFEETKVMLGYKTAEAAIADYSAAYDMPRQRAFSFSLPKLHDWLHNGDVTKPLMRAV